MYFTFGSVRGSVSEITVRERWGLNVSALVVLTVTCKYRGNKYEGIPVTR